MRFMHVVEEKNRLTFKKPLIEVIGYNRVLVENYSGIALYSTNEIHINVSFGKICISGSDLAFLKIAKEQLIITGCIDTMRICRRQL